MILSSGALISGPERAIEAPNLMFMVLSNLRERRAATAVVDGSSSMTYGGLMRNVDRVASCLIREYGITKGDVVAVSMERSISFICVVLGIQRAGAVYLPVAPGSPDARQVFVLRDAAARLLITDGTSTSAAGVATVAAEALLAEERGLPEDCFPICGGDDISYIAYTSGTTGRPKGVRITYAGICNRIAWMRRYYDFGSQDAILCKCPIDFDPSLFEIFLPLASGGRLAILKSNVQLSGEAVIAAIDRYQITFLNLVPIVLRQLVSQRRPEQCTSLRHIVCGGEAWEAELIRRTHETFPGVALYNGYGPTEASIGVTIWKSDRRAIEGPPPIGRPIENVNLIVVDEESRAVEAGAEGELWIGGVAVSPGYVGEIEDNANFVTVSLDGRRAMRFYKTGDLVRQTPEGELVYIGRRDLQVKINGMRVELEEIESIALRVAGIAQAAAAVKKVGGIAYIELYYTAPSLDSALVDRLRNTLQKSIKPSIMPQRLCRVDALPTKANGKLDRARLGELSPVEAATT